ncbi:AMIN domain-containing protein, partial [Pseudoalteromonas sp. S981]
MVEGGFIVSIELDQLKLYKTQVKNNLVYLQISENPIYEAAESNETGLDELTHFINRIQSIDFRRGEKGEAKLLVFLESSQAAIDVQERGGKIVADFHHIDILDDLLYELDVVDFGTIVSKIETFSE